MIDYQKQIDEIMDYFDFDRVKKVMDFLKWEWGYPGEVPEVAQIRQLARKLLNEAANSHISRYSTGTGGFNVYKEDCYLSLVFELAQWHCEEL